MRTVWTQSFDRGDALARDVLHRDGAGADGLTIAYHSARPAEAGPAAEFRAGETEVVAQIPKERHGGVAVESVRTVVNRELNHEGSWWRFHDYINASIAPSPGFISGEERWRRTAVTMRMGSRSKLR